MKQILSGLVLLVIGAGLVWLFGPSLMTDTQLRGARLVPANLTLKEAKCRSKVFIVSFCEVSLTRGGTDLPDMNYLIVSNLGGETIQILEDPQSKQITSSIGLDYYWNRVVSFAVTMLIFFGGGLFGLFSGIGSLLAGAREGSEQAA